MNDILTTVLSIGGLGGIIFGIYNYFRNPQINSDKTDIILNQQILDITKSLNSLTARFETHTQADISSMGAISSRMEAMDRNIVKLTTIIDERIPGRVLKDYQVNS